MTTRAKRKRKLTVGSILVPELPWLRNDDDDAVDLCPTCMHVSGERDYCDQVDCDCQDPFHCI